MMFVGVVPLSCTKSEIVRIAMWGLSESVRPVEVEVPARSTIDQLV